MWAIVYPEDNAPIQHPASTVCAEDQTDVDLN